jgi:AP2 domain
MILMHILITGIRTGIDHANGNGLDNQRTNLRPAGQRLNMANIRPQATRKSSRFKGVRLLPSGKWQARIRVGQPVYLGVFGDEEAAARAYDAAARAAWGEFGRLNFP